MTEEEKMKRLDPVILNAFADGELEPEEAARVVMHLADCPADQAVVDAIMVMNATLACACKGPLHQPVPPAIRAAIFGPPTTVSPARPARLRRLLAGWRVMAGAGALAAALAVAAAILLPPADGPMLPLGPLEPRSPMSEALDELASGQTRLVERNTELGILASFAVQGGYCREFSLRHDTRPDLVALACNDAGGWHVAALQAAPPPSSTPASPPSGYAPAGGDDDNPIGAYLDARGAGLAMAPEEEAEVLRAGWH